MRPSKILSATHYDQGESENLGFWEKFFLKVFKVFKGFKRLLNVLTYTEDREQNYDTGRTS